MRIRAAAAVAGAMLVASAVQGAAQTPQSGGRESVRAALRGEIGRYLRTRSRPEHISAVGLTITFRGNRPAIEEAVGTTRYRSGRPISSRSLWQIGSNTKGFTAVMVLQLEAEHRLSIDDTLGRWLPEYPAWRRVTIKRLLNMTSGIPDFNGQPGFVRAYVAAPSQVFSAPWLASYALGLPLEAGFDYSNTNYLLAQMIIERATRDSYADQLRKRIIAPLGLRNTFYSAAGYPRSVNARLPAGYYYAFDPGMGSLLGRDMSRQNLSNAQAAGAIVSSLQDMAKWDRALYTGRELPPKQQHELKSLVSQKTGAPIRTTTLADNHGFGLGIQQSTSTALGTVWFYEGQTIGFRVLHTFVPRSGTLIAVAVNSSVAGDTEHDKLTSLGTSIYKVLHAAGLS